MICRHCGCKTEERFCPVCGEVMEKYVPLNTSRWMIEKLGSMSGEEFEEFCMYILKRRGFLNISGTKRSGDHGIDITAEKDGISYAIQCKCYHGTVGNSAVQEAFTGKQLYRKDIAVVMTNSFFSPQAIMEADTLHVKLWDRTKLLNWLAGTD